MANEENKAQDISAPHSSHTQENGENATFNSEVMDKLPPELRAIITMQMQQSYRFGSLPNPLTDKISPEHITKVIDNNAQESKQRYNDQNYARIYHIVVVIVFLTFGVFIIQALADKNPQLVQSIFQIAAGLVAGGIGGYGFGVKHRNRD